MSNVLSESKRQQVLALGRLGWSLRRIEGTTGVRRETASAYLKAAGIAVRRTGGRPTVWPPPNPATTAEVSTDSETPRRPPSSRAPGASACEPYRALIVDAVRRGRNAMAIWQDLVDDHGFPARYASVRRFVAALREHAAVEPRAIIVTAPGEEGQVDYGEGPMVRDARADKYRRTRLFLLTLGYSRKSVRLLVWRSSAQIWAELHEQAFRRLGGTVRVIVLDNLREGVLTPDIYDPTLNPLYRDVLAHYGVVALPCRVGDPDRKGKVEAGIGHTQKTPLRGLRFETLEAAQAYLDRWSERWADTRIHGTTKRQVAAMFAEERPALGPLPLEPFRYYRYGTRTVHRWLCRNRGRVLQRPARLDRSAPGCAVDRSRRPAPRSQDRATRAGACARAARLASGRGRRSAHAHAAQNARTVRRRAVGWPVDWALCDHIYHYDG